jgi:hypothetical protein
MGPPYHPERMRARALGGRARARSAGTFGEVVAAGSRKVPS